MGDPEVTYFLIVLLSLAFSAFFSGMEIAFLSANKLRIELKNQTGSNKGRLLSFYIQNPSKFLSTILVGNNIAIVVYGIFIGMLLNPLFNQPIFIQLEALKLICITFISTAIVLITGEYVPKVLFRINPDYTLNLLIYPFQFFYYLLFPIARSVAFISTFFLQKILGKDLSNTNYVFSKVDLDHMISVNMHSTEDHEHEIDAIMFKNALGFGNLKVRDCMQPRTEIIAVSEDELPETLLQQFIDTGLSKILVYRADIDNIIGYVHQIDMFKQPKEIRTVLISIPVTNESKLASEQLQELISKRKSIAVVVDEFGITAGIITIEDILEEIFGEIADEHDIEDLKEVEINSKHFLFSARQEIDYLNDQYQLQIPEGDYETLGGYLIDLCGNIPLKGDVLQDENWKYTVTKVDKAKIVEIEVKQV